MTEAIKEKKNGLTAYLKNIKSTFRVKSCINYMVVPSCPSPISCSARISSFWKR